MSVKPKSRITRRSDKGTDNLLGELEKAIMQVIWGRELVTVRNVLDILTKDRPLAYTTVMTVMGRLVDKGLLVAEKEGKAYRYRAAMSLEELERLAADKVAHSLIADFGGEIAISQFVKALSATDPAQLARLAELARLAQEERGED